MPEAPQPAEPVEVFYSYSHKDEKLREKLDKHLSLLQRHGLINEWNDRDIEAGAHWENEPPPLRHRRAIEARPSIPARLRLPGSEPARRWCKINRTDC